MSKETRYEEIRCVLDAAGISITPPKPIQYGLQCTVSKSDLKGVLRVYQGKKGVKTDLSGIKEQGLKWLIADALGIVLEEGTSAPAAKGLVDPQKEPLPIIGVDESGKGDYFGPLVIAAVYVDDVLAKTLKELGVQDSKLLNDSKIAELSHVIQQNCPHSVVAINNDRYNTLYAKIKNLNKLLAWGHARCIENVLEKQDCPTVLSDQFGGPHLVPNALLEKGRTINLLQRTKAESNIAVAAASIVARDVFVKGIAALSRKWALTFPKGNSPAVTSAGKLFLRTHGHDLLGEVAKLHFKTTDGLME
ncbi:ribonuclease HIII [bacterium]|jgi:ribonuclease HIII|nr:ribonuclease HIII [bacterium]